LKNRKAEADQVAEAGAAIELRCVTHLYVLYFIERRILREKIT